MLDLLLLHVPKFRNYYKPIGKFSFIHLPPVGLLGLADYIRQSGLRTEVVHLGVERQKNGTLDLDGLIAGSQPSVVGLGLHWHFQSYDVIETARAIKSTHPEVSIVLGGFTASYFAEEILREFDCVDFVIRGDSEVPLVALLQHRNDRAYDQVPNLAYRKSGVVHCNDISYVADGRMLDSICYTDFTLMRDHELFVECFSNYLGLDSFSPSAQRKLFGWKRSFPVFLGRGCVYGCSYCGGASESQQIINNRRCPAMRSIPSVVSSIRDLERYGFEHGYIALDPLPLDQAETYYIELFAAIRTLNTHLSFEVERYFLPTRKFLESFRQCLSKDSFLTLSPNSHDEEIRRRNGMYRYSNRELEESLSMMEEEGVKCALFFTSGLPFETREHMQSMAEYQRHLRGSFSNVKIKNGIIELEPGSPMSCHPDSYNLHPYRTTFKEYYEYHSRPDRNHFFEMGYDREGCPTLDEIGPFFCSNFCSHFSTGKLPPFACRFLCNASERFRNAGGFKLLNRLLS